MRVCEYASTWPKVNLTKRANVNLARKVNLAKSEQTGKKDPWVLVTLHIPCPYCHLPTIRYLGRVLLWPKVRWSSGGQVEAMWRPGGGQVETRWRSRLLISVRGVLKSVWGVPHEPLPPPQTATSPTNRYLLHEPLPPPQTATSPTNCRTKGPRDQGKKEPRDQGTKGPRDKGTKGPRGQGTKGPRDPLRGCVACVVVPHCNSDTRCHIPT
jgi:hypothetical protein